MPLKVYFKIQNQASPNDRFVLFLMSVQSELFSSAPLVLLLILRRRYAFRLLEYL